jgi:chitodextrinase
VNLSWNASTDNVGVTAYDIYRNGTLVGSVSGTQTTFTDTGLSPVTTYSYYVRARDARNNASASSNSISVTTLELIPENRLVNPGFDQSNSVNKPASWVCENDYFCYRDTNVKRSGTASMRMSGDSGPWLGFYQSVTASAGENYTFDGYYNSGSNSGATIEFHVRFLNGSGSVIQDNLLLSTTGNSTGWVNVNGSRVAPANTAHAQVYIYLRDLRGAIYFDDFSLIGGTGAPPADTQAPTAPTGLTSPAKTTTTVNLSWTASTDNVGVTGYDVYRGTTLAGSTTGASATTFQATGLTANTAYTFTVKAKDAAGNVSAASNAVTVTTNAATGGGTGSIGREYWTGISGTSLSSVPWTTAPSGTSTLSSFETPTNWADNYGTRVRGYITPSTTGSYTFYIASDDASELWLSADANPANKTKIASVAGWTGVRQWNASGTQQSAAINLSAGQAYYVEALHKEGDGGDNLAVGWTGPGISSITVIDGSFLSPYSPPADTQAPSAPTGLTSPAKTDTTVSLSWTASTDNVGVTGYEIYRGATLAGTTTGATTFQATGLTPNTAYSFTVKAKDAAGNVSAASSALNVTTNASSGGGSNGDGLTGAYYDYSDLTNHVVTRIDPTINFNWDHAAPAAGMGENTFSIRWTGKVKPQYSESYTFYAYADDGVRVWVNNQLIIDYWQNGWGERTGTITLAADALYDIKVEYFDDGGGARMELSWSSASQAKQIVPQNRLYSQ